MEKTEMKTASKNNRRNFVQKMLTNMSVGALATSAAKGMGSRIPKQPNFLFILTDQQHIDTISSMGCKWLNTPWQDKLQKNGYAFKQSYSTYPVCSPARSSLVTGRMPRETGVYKNGISINESIPNIGQWLGDRGYDSIYAGKWHVPEGFTFNIPGFTVLTPGVAGHGALGDTCTSQACEAYIRSNRQEKPFFLFCSIFQPHDICQWLRIYQNGDGSIPFKQVADKLPDLPDNFDALPMPEGKYVKRRRNGDEPLKGNWTKDQWRWYRYSYYRMIEQLDQEVGRVIQALEDTGLDKNTVIIFTSDHGEGLGHHQTVRKNRLFDEAARVPLIISYPGKIKAGVVDEKTVVTGLDLMPTICTYAGVPVPEGVTLARDLSGLMAGKTDKLDREYIVCESAANGRMVRTDRYKFVAYANDPNKQLFDMQEDPGETTNLVNDSRFADLVKEMDQKILDWEKSLVYDARMPKKDGWWPGA